MKSISLSSTMKVQLYVSSCDIDFGFVISE